MENKSKFLKERLVSVLRKIDPNTKAVFGKMNVHQMIEHMSHAFQIANGKVVFANSQSEELTAKMFRFMMSDRPFRDNTPNPNLSDEPLPPRYSNIEDSLGDLQIEVDYFFEIFEEKNLRITNPFFGDLNFEEQIHLLHKHALHHMRQFNSLLE